MNITTTTCNEQCWTAREDICSCSCGGANHGILRPDHANFKGEQPTRNSRIKNARYLLKAVGRYSELSRERYRIQAGEYNTLLTYYERQMARKNGEPAVMKRATADQAARWPEAYGFMTSTARSERDRPYLLWIREDLAEKYA